MSKKTYQDKKTEIRAKANDFFLLEDLFALADSYLLAGEILEDNNFPLKEYIKYKKQK